MRSRLTIPALLCLLLANTTAWGTTLFTFTVQVGGSQPGVVNSMSYPIAFGSAQPSTGIFFNRPFTTADVGRVLTIAHGTDPNFDAFTTMLKNATPEITTFWFLPAPATNDSGVGWSTEDVLTSNETQPLPDLTKWSITSYSLKQNSLTTSFDSSTGRSTFQSSITFSADGVPEPSTTALALVTLCGLLGRRSKKDSRGTRRKAEAGRKCRSGLATGVM